jgi:protein transport protein SEC24
VNGMQNLQVQQQEQQSPLQPPNNMNGVPPPTSSNRAKRVYNSAAGGVPASQPFSPSSTTNNYPNNSPAAPMQQQPMQQPASYPPQGNGAPAPGSARSGGYSNTPVSSQNKIDPSQIPSPVVLFQTEQEYFTQNPYYTNPKRFTDISPPSPPSSVLEYFVIDDGNCSPRFMRSTTYALPTTADLANTLNIPLGLIIQPLAELREDEVPLQVVDFGETGPIRCSSCRGYINCHVTFIDGGRRFRCNICSQENEGRIYSRR